MAFPSRWSEYYRNTEGRPPRPTLMFALDRFTAPGFAVDLGCGEGRDTIELLRRNWTVLALDSEPTAIAGLMARHDLPSGNRLDTRVARFEDTIWPSADLVNASFALFFCAATAFDPLWRKMIRSLKPGGRFAGQLLGENDSWAQRRNVVTHDRAGIDRLVVGLTIELHEIEETDGVTPRGEAKHWHIHHLVLTRP